MTNELIVGIISIGSIIVAYFLGKKKSDKEVESIAVSTMEKVVKTINDQIDRLNDQINIQHKEYDILKRKYNELYNKYSELNKKYNELKRDKDAGRKTP